MDRLIADKVVFSIESVTDTESSPLKDIDGDNAFIYFSLRFLV
jgi:hypothetical protein